MSDLPELYPLLFEPILSERPWGGDSLRTRFNKPTPPDKIIGESWEIDNNSVIVNGALKGRTLRDVLAEYGDALAPNDRGDFPLLAKFLDAREWLSVQVHPDDAHAMQIEGQPRGKTECWYIVHAEPGAKLAFGTTHAMSAETFRAAVQAGEAESVMAYVPVKDGDFLYVEAGTMHALGPGLLIYELQQSSDTTYRVYDWGRIGKDGQPRELHLEKALQVTNFTPRPDPLTRYPVFRDNHGNRVAELVRSPYFALDRVALEQPETTFGTNGTCRLLTVIAGSITVDGVSVPLGGSALIPADLGRYTLTQAGGTVVLIGWPRG